MEQTIGREQTEHPKVDALLVLGKGSPGFVNPEGTSDPDRPIVEDTWRTIGEWIKERDTVAGIKPVIISTAANVRRDGEEQEPYSGVIRDTLGKAGVEERDADMILRDEAHETVLELVMLLVLLREWREKHGKPNVHITIVAGHHKERVEFNLFFKRWGLKSPQYDRFQRLLHQIGVDRHDIDVVTPDELLSSNRGYEQPLSSMSRDSIIAQLKERGLEYLKIMVELGGFQGIKRQILNDSRRTRGKWRAAMRATMESREQRRLASLGVKRAILNLNNWVRHGILYRRWEKN